MILTGTGPGIRAAKQATRTISIVMGNSGDPVAQGFVASLSWPGGNITGLANMYTALIGKRHRLQPLVHEKAMVAPIRELAFISGVGPRVEESGLGLIAGSAFSALYEDVKRKAK